MNVAADRLDAAGPDIVAIPAALKAIRTQVMWNRLIAVVEEQAQALLRTAFGSVAREAGDLSAGVYDRDGKMLAQAVTGTPGHVNSMASAVGHFLARFDRMQMQRGDVFITNDPWLGTGHLFDYVVVTPVFGPCGGSPLALFASTCHTIDVGGIGFSAEARSVFEEGTRIPHLRLARAGMLNEDVLAIVQANSRNPIEARGDILSLMSCNEVGVTRLLEMMAEFGLDDIDGLAQHILAHSRDATRAAIARLPRGRWYVSMSLDGYDRPVELRAALAIAGEQVIVDYAGSSRESARGINSPKCYTDAYSVYGLKCLIAPDVPNNAGSLEPFVVLPAPGTIVDPEPPAPVTARHVVGQMLPDLMFGGLEAVFAGAVPAESAGSIWVLAMAQAAAAVCAHGGREPRFNVMSVGLGGTGARPTKDGLSATAFPSGVGGIPVEVTEAQAPVVFIEKTFLTDSGGAGTWRGGLGQRIVVTSVHQQAFTCAAATFDRRSFPARGRSGGQDGAPGKVEVIDGDGRVTPFYGKGTIHIPKDGCLRIELPGGGGFGSPAEREPARVAADLAHELISPESATRVYQAKSLSLLASPKPSPAALNPSP